MPNFPVKANYKRLLGKMWVVICFFSVLSNLSQQSLRDFSESFAWLKPPWSQAIWDYYLLRNMLFPDWHVIHASAGRRCWFSRRALRHSTTSTMPRHDANVAYWMKDVWWRGKLWRLARHWFCHALLFREMHRKALQKAKYSLVPSRALFLSLDLVRDLTTTPKTCYSALAIRL